MLLRVAPLSSPNEPVNESPLFEQVGLARSSTVLLRIHATRCGAVGLVVRESTAEVRKAWPGLGRNRRIFQRDEKAGGLRLEAGVNAEQLVGCCFVPLTSSLQSPASSLPTKNLVKKTKLYEFAVQSVLLVARLALNGARHWFSTDYSISPLKTSVAGPVI